MKPPVTYSNLNRIVINKSANVKNADETEHCKNSQSSEHHFRRIKQPDAQCPVLPLEQLGAEDAKES